ncbi:MAG: hypothetical protein ABFC75_01680 [Rectinema sp.]
MDSLNREAGVVLFDTRKLVFEYCKGPASDDPERPFVRDTVKFSVQGGEHETVLYHSDGSPYEESIVQSAFAFSPASSMRSSLVEFLCDQTSAFWEVIIEIGKSGAIRLRKF